MRTLIYPRTWGPYRTVQVPDVPITTLQAVQVCQYLDITRHIPVTAGVDNGCAVHLWPRRDVTTAEEVAVLAQFRAVTDSRLIWHRYDDTVWTKS